jgi:hypothetical protein
MAATSRVDRYDFAICGAAEFLLARWVPQHLDLCQLGKEIRGLDRPDPHLAYSLQPTA